jgi:hypothetical protein
VNAAAALLGLSWDAVQSIMDRAVARGLERRETTTFPIWASTRRASGRGMTTLPSSLISMVPAFLTWSRNVPRRLPRPSSRR